jgi:hypothetical protein
LLPELPPQYRPSLLPQLYPIAAGYVTPEELRVIHRVSLPEIVTGDERVMVFQAPAVTDVTF